jgi:hypothetical protein
MTSSGSDSNGSGSGLNLPIDGVRGMSIAVVDADFGPTERHRA